VKEGREEIHGKEAARTCGLEPGKKTMTGSEFMPVCKKRQSRG